MPNNDDVPHPRDRRPTQGSLDRRGPNVGRDDTRWQHPASRDTNPSPYVPPRQPQGNFGASPSNDRQQQPDNRYSGFSRHSFPSNQRPENVPQPPLRDPAQHNAGPPTQNPGFRQEPPFTPPSDERRNYREPRFDPFPQTSLNTPVNPHERDPYPQNPVFPQHERDDLFGRGSGLGHLDQGGYQPSHTPLGDYPSSQSSNLFSGDGGFHSQDFHPQERNAFDRPYPHEARQPQGYAERGQQHEPFDAPRQPPQQQPSFEPALRQPQTQLPASSFDRHGFDDRSQQPAAFGQGFHGESSHLSQGSHLGHDDAAGDYHDHHGEGMDEDFFGDEDDLDHEEYVQPARRGKMLIWTALAAAITVGGGGAYWFKFVKPSKGAPESASLIAADRRPAKVNPENAGGKSFGSGETKAIYDRLTPNGPVSGAQTASLVTTNSLENRIDEALRKAQQAGSNAGGDAPRTNSEVPTVVQPEIYGPDGNRVDNSRKVVTPTLTPVQSGTYSPFFGNTAPQQQQAAASNTGSQPQLITAPEQQPRRQQQASLRQAAVQPAFTATTATAQTAPASASASGYFAQLKSAQDSAAVARELASLTSKYSGVLGSVQLTTKNVDLGAKGNWTRIIAGPVDSKEAAQELCQKLKGAGLQSCIVAKIE